MRVRVCYVIVETISPRSGMCCLGLVVVNVCLVCDL